MELARSEKRIGFAGALMAREQADSEQASLECAAASGEDVEGDLAATVVTGDGFMPARSLNAIGRPWN